MVSLSVLPRMFETLGSEPRQWRWLIEAKMKG
jgi:hypothetical protein